MLSTKELVSKLNPLREARQQLRDIARSEDTYYDFCVDKQFRLEIWKQLNQCFGEKSVSRSREFFEEKGFRGYELWKYTYSSLQAREARVRE